MAHVIYNSVGTLVALALLESLVLTGTIGKAKRLLHDELTVEFTLFYCLNMGLALAVMLPFETSLVRWLKSRFHDRKALGTPRHFDPNRLYHPAEGLRALHREILRFGETSLGMLDTALNWQMKNGWVYPVDLSLEEREMDRLSEYIHWFASRLGRQQQTQDMSRAVQVLSMASRHFESVSDLSKKISRLKAKFTEPLPYCLALELLCEWSESLRRLLAFITEPMLDGDLAEIRNADAEFALLEDQKIALRGEILSAGSTRQMSSSQTIILIDLIDTCRHGMRDQFRGIYETWQLKDELADLKSEVEVAESIG
jgi:Na+/phosphate symporter